MRKSSIVVFVMAFLLMAMPAFAQDSSPWSAYLFDSVNNELVQISSSGETERFSLAIPTGSYIYGMSVNSDGSQVAYCYDYRVDLYAEGVMKLVVRDIDQEASLYEIELGQAIGCSVSAFQSDVLALSIVYAYAFNEVEGAYWELRLLDPITGETLSSLTNESPEMPDVASFGQADVSVLAQVRELSRESVKFMAIPYVGSEGPAEMPAFEWNVSAGTVRELPAAYGRYNADFLPETGEVVFPVLDESLAYAIPEGPVPQANQVKILDAEGERIIYQNTEMVIVDTHFVNNGDAVLVSMIPGLIEDHPEYSTQSRYALIKRDGTVVEFSEAFDGAVFVEAIPNGALFVYTPNPSGSNEISVHVLTLSNEGVLSPFADLELDARLGWSPAQLIWTSPSSIASDLAPFVGQ
jgi:hypothetical protein